MNVFVNKLQHLDYIQKNSGLDQTASLEFLSNGVNSFRFHSLLEIFHVTEAEGCVRENLQLGLDLSQTIETHKPCFHEFVNEILN